MRHRDFRGFLAELPVFAAAVARVDEALGAKQIGRRRGNAVTAEVRRRGDHAAARLGNAARGHVGIGELAHAQGDVDAFLDEVDIPVVEHQFEFEVRMVVEKRRQTRHDMQPRETHRRRDPQFAREAGRRAARGNHGFVGFLHRAFRALVEAGAGFGRREGARGAKQELTPSHSSSCAIAFDTAG